MSAFREYRRRNEYRLSLIDELHYQLCKAEPFEGAKIRVVRNKYLLKLFRYKRRAKGASHANR
ncbi:hypothetical protein [Pseudomonas sp. Marseille-P9899]|uniref:hypothetical protein n=1 Tax=Pseudomonas sp. Marseille-P9899 TaxID=2730401 RepID=UPI00158DD9AF|nr:hypothetical protein [Pseudomonas sp. Marseille-P9899]